VGSDRTLERERHDVTTPYNSFSSSLTAGLSWQLVCFHSKVVHASLIFVSKSGALPWVGRFLALLANMKVAGANTLAYFTPPLLTKQKSCCNNDGRSETNGVQAFYVSLWAHWKRSSLDFKNALA